MDITLEKVDKVRERTGVSYSEAKKALEANNGDVLDSIIYLEENNKVDSNISASIGNEETIDELKEWLRELIKKGNVSRIRITKDEAEIVDVPVNAGIAAGVIAICIPALLAFGVIAAVATKVTIEITMADGSVEVVNKYVVKAVEEVKEKTTDISNMVKDKISEVKGEGTKYTANTHKSTEEAVYSYTVNFDDIE